MSRARNLANLINTDLTGGVGATGGGTDEVFYQNNKIVTTNYTIPSAVNALCAGPITINTGVTVTIETGAVWTIV